MLPALCPPPCHGRGSRSPVYSVLSHGRHRQPESPPRNSPLQRQHGVRLGLLSVISLSPALGIPHTLRADALTAAWGWLSALGWGMEQCRVLEVHRGSWDFPTWAMCPELEEALPVCRGGDDPGCVGVGHAGQGDTQGMLLGNREVPRVCCCGCGELLAASAPQKQFSFLNVGMLALALSHCGLCVCALLPDRHYVPSLGTAASPAPRSNAGSHAGGGCWWARGWVLQVCTDQTSLQERQRLETILNLCAEYTKTDGSELLPGHADAGRRAPRGTAGLGRAAEELGVLRQRESLERSDEENLKEECSSTESTHHEVRGWGCPGCAVPCRAVLTCPSAA